MFNVEESWFRCAMIKGLSQDQLSELARSHRAAIKNRSKLVEGEDLDFRAIFEDARDLQDDFLCVNGNVDEIDDQGVKMRPVSVVRDSFVIENGFEDQTRSQLVDSDSCGGIVQRSKLL